MMNDESHPCPNCKSADGCDCDPFDVLGAVVEQNPIPSGRGYPAACPDCASLKAELAVKTEALEELITAVSLDVQSRPSPWRFSTPRLEQADTAARRALTPTQTPGVPGAACTCPFPREKCPRCAHPCGACEAASLAGVPAQGGGKEVRIEVDSWVRRIAKECAFRSICPGGHGDVGEIERAILHVIERCAEKAEQGVCQFGDDDTVRCAHTACAVKRVTGRRVRALAAPGKDQP